MITINAGCATLGAPIFSYIVDRTGSYAIGLAGAGGICNGGHYWLITLLKDHRID